ncbi:MAG: copper transporter [Actinomycetaceae bacterium]|nr:copper transporter [Actinomycetaceae bacterium]
MVDFRYHLVSLISVFIALALGVVLGAGPLQTPIASGLTGQVATLREEQAAISAQVETARNDIAQRNEWITANTSQLVEGTLQDVNVAIVSFEDTRAEDVDAATALLTSAGAKVNQKLTVTSAWTQAQMSQYRSSLSSAIGTHLATKPADDASAAAILAQGLVEAITRDDAEAKVVREMLSDESNSLVTFGQEPVKSEAVLIVGAPSETPAASTPTPTPTPSAEATPTPVGEPDPNMWLELARFAAQAPKSAVVVGGAKQADDLVAIVRAAQIPVTTVDSVDTSMGIASAVMALPSADATQRAYGFAGGASDVLPPLVKPNPTAQPEETPSE